VQPGDLIVVDAAGQVIAGGGKASAETALHLEIVSRCDAGAVLHTHSQAATLLSRRALADPRPGQDSAPKRDGVVQVEGLEMLKGLDGISTHATAIEIPVLANDQNLPRLSQRAGPLLGDAPQGLLIAGHGLYAWGPSLSQAIRHLEILEFLLEQSWRQLLLEALLTRPASGQVISHG
jgi:methylthioribulose-1-phosphate dehydratase